MNRILLTNGMRKYLLMAAMLLAGTLTAGAQTKYVFMYDNHFLANNPSGTISNASSFDPNTCIWTGNSGSTFTNNGWYLRHYQTDGQFTLSNSADGSWTNLTINGQTIYRAQSGNYAARYLYYNNGWTANRYNSSNVVYEVATTPVAAILTDVSINGDATLSTTGAHPYTLTDGSYTEARTNYRFNNADHIYPATPTTTTVTPVGTWSVSGTGASYVTVDENTGTITVNSLPTDGDKTITLSCDPMYGTAHGATVTKTITLKARCQTPTFSFNNSNNQVTITTGTSGATIYYTTDGSEPTTSSTLYSGPFAQSTAATIKAIAVKAGSANSEVGEFNVVKLATPDMEFDAAGTTATFSSSDEGVTFHYNSYDVDHGASDPGNPITNGTTWNGSSVVTFSSNDLCKLATTKAATATTGYINSDVFLRRANNTNMTNRNFVFFYDDGVDVHFMANQGGTVSNTTTFNPSTCIWEGEFFANADASLAEIGLYYEPFVRYKNNGKYLKIYNGGSDFDHIGYESGKLRLTNSLGDSLYFFPFTEAGRGSLIHSVILDPYESPHWPPYIYSFKVAYNTTSNEWERYFVSDNQYGIYHANNRTPNFTVIYPVEELGGGDFLLNVAYPANYETVKEEINKGQSVTITSSITGPNGTGTGSYGLPYYRVGNEVKYFFYYPNTSTPLASEPNEFSTDIRITYDLLNGTDYIEIDNATHTYTLVRDPGRDLYVTVRITATPYINDIAQPDGIQTKDYQFHILTRPPFPAPVISRVEGTNDYQMECSASNAVIEYRVNGSADCNVYGDNESATHPGWCIYDGPITVTTAGTVITARSYRASDQLMSDPVDYLVGGAMLLPPTIEIDDDGNVTITANPANSSLEDYTSESFYYTVNGSDPDPSNVGPVTKYYSGSFTVTNGQIVKAIAKADGFTNSAIASETYKIASGTSSYGVVTLNDYEDHNWSYYQASADLPAGYPDALHSPYPRNVQITYYGYGDNTLSTNNSATPAASTFTGNTTAADVKVGIVDEGHTFLYYKTLERDANGRYPYELIPNPFYVRPAVTSYTGSRTLRLVMNDVGGDGWASQLQVNFSDGSSTRNFQLESGSTKTETFTVNSGVTVTLSWVVGGGKNNECSFTLSYDGGEEIYSSGMNPKNGKLKVFKVAGTYTVSSYTGFYKWRVKSITDGTIYTASTGNTSVAVGDMMDAETTYYFVPSDASTTNANNATSMKVELEALWALAAVNSNTNYSSVERNFRVARSGTANAIIYDSRPCTYSSFYPNGTTDGTTAATESDILSIHNNSNISLSYDAKIEYYKINGNTTTINCNNHNLIIGRGVLPTNTLCATMIRGFEATRANSYDGSQGAVNNRIRVESGTWGSLYLLNNTYYTRNNNIYNMRCNATAKVKCTIGNDYDRAKEEDNLLSIAAGNEQNVYGSERTTFSSADNKDNLTFDWIIKSGILHGNKLGDASADYSIYIGSASSSGYLGKRRITVEGGVLASIAGSLNSADNNNYDNNYTTQTASDVVTIRIKGGKVRGAIYGAAAFAGAAGGRTIILTGGTVNGWIAGGCNGTRSDGGQLYGSTYLYVGGTANVIQSENDPYIGGNTYDQNDVLQGVNGAYGGNIFGAGCGIKPDGYSEDNPGATLNNLTVGKVYGSNITIADESVVGRDVYGGGNFGCVDNSWTNNNSKTTNIYILGGTVNGNVFGGSNNQQGQTVNITMNGGLVKKGIYGGSNSWGNINNNVTMKINGGQVGVDADDADHLGYVHGGGLGNATRVLGSVNMTIGKSVGAENYVTIFGDVYGGSAQGRTNGNNSRTANAVTNVTMNAGKIHGSLYGGGLGTNDYAAHVYGPVQVTVNGGGIHATHQDGSGAVYGCNNVKGAPQSTVNVDIYGTDAPADGREYALDAVYGGGNKAGYTGTPVVKVHNCDNSIEYVYGGGNAANVAGTNVTIYGGDSIGYVFAGGNGTVSEANVTGNVLLNIHGGVIRHVFGGNNTSGTIGGTITVNVAKQTEAGHDPCPMKIGEVFSGGNMANSQAGSITIGCTGDYVEATGSDRYGYELEGIGDVYGGANKANVSGNISLTINGGIINRVFGGNNFSGTISGTINVIINKTQSCGWYVGYVYGGGNQAAYTAPSVGYPNVSVRNGKVTYDVYGGGFGDLVDNSQGKITGSTYVETINTGSVGRHVFGGGNAAAVTNDTDVRLLGKARIFGNIYGGGNQGEIGGKTKVIVNSGN